MSFLRGIIPPLITPFKRDYSIDFEALNWVLDYVFRGGVHGVFVNSTTGEFVHLSESEMISLAKYVVERYGGKLLVLSTATSNSTDQAIRLGREMINVGVRKLVVAPPYYFKIDPGRLEKHYSRIAESIDGEVIIYNIPSTTGIVIPINVIKRLVIEHSNIIGIKNTYENFVYMKDLVSEIKSIRRDFSVLTGVDEMILPTLLLGGDGGIAALANVIPRIYRELYDAWIDQRINEAIEKYRYVIELSKVYRITSLYPVAIKTMLYLMGAPIEPLSREPLYRESEEVVEKLREFLMRQGLYQVLKRE